MFGVESGFLMMKTTYKIGLAICALILATLCWRGINSADVEQPAEEEISSRSQAWSNPHKISESRESGGNRFSSHQRVGHGGSEDLEGDDYPTINLEEVNALIESGDVVGMELRGHGGSLIDPNESLATVLKLRTDETAAINEMWSQLLPELNKLRAEHVKSQTMEDGEVWVGVEVFSEKGDLLRQDFIGQIHDLVGEQRGGLFLQGIQAHDAYGQWGKTVGSGFSIKVREQEDGSYLYEITEQAQDDAKAARQWKSDRVPTHLEVLAEAAHIVLKP